MKDDQKEAQKSRREATRYVMNWLVQVSRDRCLTAGLTVRLGIVLTQFYNHGEGWARPSQATLAARLGCTRNGVALAVRRLARAGHVTIVPGRGAGNANRYILHLHA